MLVQNSTLLDYLEVLDPRTPAFFMCQLSYFFKKGLNILCMFVGNTEIIEDL